MKKLFFVLLLIPLFATAQATDEWELNGGTKYGTKQACIDAAPTGVNECRPVTIVTKTDLPPEITLTPDPNNPYTVGDTYQEAGFSCSDPEDGDCTASVTQDTPQGFDNTTPGTYPIVYSVTDSDGNTDSAQRDVIFNPPPNTSPTVNAGPDITVTAPDPVDPLQGATCTDPEDGPLTCNAVNLDGLNINQTTPGIYNFEVNATDSQGLPGTPDSLQVVVLDPQQTGEPGQFIDTGVEVVPNVCFDSSQRTSLGHTNWQAGDCVIIDSAFVLDQSMSVDNIVVYPGGSLSCAAGVGMSINITGTIIVAEGGSFVCDSTAQVNFNFNINSISDDILGGVIALGNFTARGETKTPYCRAVGPPNQSVILDCNPTGWEVGDKLLLPKSDDCDGCGGQTEELTLQSVSGNQVTFTAPPQFAHPCAQDRDGSDQFCPHVLNISRSMTFTSTGTVNAHSMCHANANCDIQYVAFDDFGRTDIRDLDVGTGNGNVKGRYPVHAHHLDGQMTINGSVVDFGVNASSRKWGITIHNSRLETVSNNIVYRAAGAAIVTEDPEATDNDFIGNFVVMIVDGNGERLHDPDPGDGSKLGRAGVGFWFNGPLNTIDNNIAADVYGCIYCWGFKIDNLYNGGSASNPGPAYMSGFISFDGNEVYGSNGSFSVWWICTFYTTPVNSCSTSMDNLTAWNVSRWFYGYESNNLTITNYTQRNGGSFWFGDYVNRNLSIINADIYPGGITTPSHRGAASRMLPGETFETTLIQDGQVGFIRIFPPSNVNGSAGIAPFHTIIDGTLFNTLQMDHTIHTVPNNVSTAQSNTGCIVDDDYRLKATYMADEPNKISVPGITADVYQGCQ